MPLFYNFEPVLFKESQRKSIFGFLSAATACYKEYPSPSKQPATTTLFPVLVNLPPIDLAEGSADVLPVVAYFYNSFIM